jgi:hypothetical protein
MRFFLDNCVPESVRDVLTAAGHEVIRQREAIASDSSDTLVAIASVTNAAILVSHDKDFKAIASRVGVSQTRLRKLSRIHFRCAEPKAARRMRDALDLIEYEWSRAQNRADQRMFIEIQDNGLKTVR